MTPPFTIQEFLAVFAAYNAAIWPVQIAAYGLGLVVVAAVLVQRNSLLRLALGALGILWAVTGVGYHLMYFARINPIAPLFAGVFVLQSVLLLASAVRPGDLRVQPGRDLRSVAGAVTIAYAVVIYPLLGIWAGHGLMAGLMFGVAPCPLTIFTIGLLLLSRGAWVVWLSVIPFLWSLIGLAAAIQLGIPEDLAMPVAGFALVVALAVQARAFRRGRSASV